MIDIKIEVIMIGGQTKLLKSLKHSRHHLRVKQFNLIQKTFKLNLITTSLIICLIGQIMIIHPFDEYYVSNPPNPNIYF